MRSEAKQVLDCAMRGNDADAETIREYLKALLTALWEEGEGFSGKRPFGNSCWEYELYGALIAGNFVEGELYSDGVQSCDVEAARKLISIAIEGLR